MSAQRRTALASAKRVVVKIGTNALTNTTGRFHRPHFERLANELLALAKTRELVIVSSGAIAATGCVPWRRLVSRTRFAATRNR